MRAPIRLSEKHPPRLVFHASKGLNDWLGVDLCFAYRQGDGSKSGLCLSGPVHGPFGYPFNGSRCGWSKPTHLMGRHKLGIYQDLERWVLITQQDSHHDTRCKGQKNSHLAFFDRCMWTWPIGFLVLFGSRNGYLNLVPSAGLRHPSVQERWH